MGVLQRFYFFIVHWAGTLKSSKKNIIVIGHWAGVLKSLICFIIDNWAGVLVFFIGHWAGVLKLQKSALLNVQRADLR